MYIVNQLHKGDLWFVIGQWLQLAQHEILVLLTSPLKHCVYFEPKPKTKTSGRPKQNMIYPQKQVIFTFLSERQLRATNRVWHHVTWYVNVPNLILVTQGMLA